MKNVVLQTIMFKEMIIYMAQIQHSTSKVMLRCTWSN